MSARKTLITFVAVWLSICMICSILSAFAYSSDAATPDKPDADKPAADVNKEEDPSDPPATKDPDAPSTNEDPAPSGNTPYDKLTYSASNAQYLIFVDAGHGWYDPGSSVKADDNGIFDPEGKEYLEKDINLQIAKKVKKALEKMGYTVGETRPGDGNADCPVPLVNDMFYAKDRPAYVNEQGADYFVSIHCNTFDDPSVNGTRIFYSTARDSTLQLANSIMSAMQAEMSDKVAVNPDNQLYILLYSSMPAVLIESAFLTNQEDFSKLIDPDWQDQFACVIAKGIDADLHARNGN